MTNEHDVEVARIMAALQLVTATGDADDPLGKAASDFLVRQLSPPGPVTVGDVGPRVEEEEAPPFDRCLSCVPGRTMLREDAVRCKLARRHDGPCHF